MFTLWYKYSIPSLDLIGQAIHSGVGTLHGWLLNSV